MYWSFFNPLPWVGCDHSWNTENCYESLTRRLLHPGNFTDGNKTDIMTTELMPTTAAAADDYVTGNMTDMVVNATVKRVRASEEFWLSV